MNMSLLIDKISNIIHYGEKGKQIASNLVKKGVKTRLDLKKPEFFNTLPKICQMYIKYNPVKKIPIKIGLEIIKKLQKLSSHLIPVGSISRKELFSGDIDLLVNQKDIQELKNNIQELKNIQKLKNNIQELKNIQELSENPIYLDEYIFGSTRQAWVILYKNKKYLLDLFIYESKELPYMLFHYIGPKSYNIRTRAYAKRNGWLLNQYGLWDVNNPSNRVKDTSIIKTEKQLTSFLGITYYQPEERI